VTVNIVWIVVIFLDGVGPSEELAQPQGGAGHYLSLPARPGTYQCNLVGFQLDPAAVVEVVNPPPCLPFPIPTPDFGVTVQNVAVKPDNGSQPGCLSFELVIAGAASDGGYGLVYEAGGRRTVIGDVSALSGGGCPKLVSISPQFVGVSPSELVTAAGVDLQSGTWTATAQGFAGPLPVPVTPLAGPQPPGTQALTLDTSRAEPGPGTLTFTPNNPNCPPTSVPFQVTIA